LFQHTKTLALGVVENWCNVVIVLTRNHREYSQLNASTVSPETLSERSLEEIRNIKIEHGRKTVPLGEVFDVSRKQVAIEDPKPATSKTPLPETPLPELLWIEGDCSTISHLGAKLRTGTLVVRGNVGDFLGERMSGGRIFVSGNTGHCMSQSMSGGLIYVDGNSGDCIAGPSPGKQSGMRGGDVIVTGSCGVRVAERMRRGTIFVGGNAGDFGCARMIAGTVICLGTAGKSWCQGMKRGTVILLHDLDDRRLHQFSSPRDFELSFLPLIWKHLSRSVDEAIALLHAVEQEISISKHLIPTTRWVKRRVGDLECQGAGEILILQRITSELLHRIPSSLNPSGAMTT
jgi:formylmethanofuran dehydrogenase subunit C